MTVSEQQLAKAARKDIRARMKWDEAHEWQFHEEPEKYSPEELAQVQALQEQWAALSARGQNEGWLEWGGGYRDGEWEIASNHIHPTRKIKVRESKATRAQRISMLSEDIEARVAKRVAA